MLVKRDNCLYTEQKVLNSEMFIRRVYSIAVETKSHKYRIKTKFLFE